MRRLPLTFFTLVLSLSLGAQYLYQVKKDTVIKWFYADGDEFDAGRLDTAKWIPAYSYSQMNYQFRFLMKPERIEFRDGVARFMCYRDTGIYTVPAWQLSPTFEKDNRVPLIDGNKVNYYFTLGTVWSRKQYGKGYFEIRFRASDAYGMWPAFWMYGNNQHDEIDFFELKGERNSSVHINVHCPSGCNKHPELQWMKTTQKLKDGFNVLAGEWEDGYVKWYLNGEGIGYFEGDFISKAMNVIAGTGLARDGFGFEPGVNASTVFPNSFDVDYIRIWHKKNEGKQPAQQFSFYKDDGPRSFPKNNVRNKRQKKYFKNDLITISLLPSGAKKFILTSEAEQINYRIIFTDASGKELISETIAQPFREFDFETASGPLRMKISVGDKTIEELVNLSPN